MTSTAEEPGQHRGRALDVTRCAALRDAALELLAEIGYDRLTIDSVAARAHASKATIYRRWPGKAELVVDALTLLKGAPLVPDTGTLRGDLEAIAQGSSERGQSVRRPADDGPHHRPGARRRAAPGLPGAPHRSAHGGTHAASSSRRWRGARWPGAATSSSWSRCIPRSGAPPAPASFGDVPEPHFAQQVIDDVILPARHRAEIHHPPVHVHRTET